MTETPKGWQLLHSKLPPAAIKPLATSVYGVAGLSDVNEGFLIQRLFASGFAWDWRIVRQEYLGAEDRAVRDKDYTQRYYLAAVHGELNLEGRMFHGSGASDNRKLDAAYKGAATVAFKNACKWAGLTAELFLDGRAIDHIYQGRVTKDPDMAPASVDTLVAQITDTYGDPAQTAQDEAELAAEQAKEDEAIRLLIQLAAELPETPRDEAKVRELLKQYSYKAVLARVTNDHRLQCPDPCPHLVKALELTLA